MAGQAQRMAALEDQVAELGARLERYRQQAAWSGHLKMSGPARHRRTGRRVRSATCTRFPT